MKNSTFYKLYHPIQDYLFIIAGSLLYGFGFNGFLLSNDIIIGGLSGLCSLLFFATGIPVSISYFAINILLIALAFKILGLKFLINTIVGVISLSLSLSLFEWLLGGVPIIEGQLFMSVIIGGLICGVGLGIIFSANGSTGGTDIIAAIINKYKRISIGRGLLLCDLIIISSSFLMFHSVELIVFGFAEMLVETTMLDQVINGNKQSVQFLIISKNHEAIVKRILEDMGRGCTLLDAHGGFSGEPYKVIMLLTKRTESSTVFRLVKSIDPNAFISESNVRGVYGEGFDVLKT